MIHFGAQSRSGSMIHIEGRVWLGLLQSTIDPLQRWCKFRDTTFIQLNPCLG